MDERRTPRDSQTNRSIDPTAHYVKLKSVKILETGFEYVTDYSDRKVFKKRK